MNDTPFIRFDLIGKERFMKDFYKDSFEEEGWKFIKKQVANMPNEGDMKMQITYKEDLSYGIGGNITGEKEAKKIFDKFIKLNIIK